MSNSRVFHFSQLSYDSTHLSFSLLLLACSSLSLIPQKFIVHAKRNMEYGRLWRWTHIFNSSMIKKEKELLTSYLRLKYPKEEQKHPQLGSHVYPASISEAKRQGPTWVTCQPLCSKGESIRERTLRFGALLETQRNSNILAYLYPFYPNAGSAQKLC